LFFAHIADLKTYLQASITAKVLDIKH